MFAFFSKRGKSAGFGVEDVTLEVDDLINLFKKIDVLNDKGGSHKLQIGDLIASIEKYYSPNSKLEAKLSHDQFQAFIKANPSFLHNNGGASTSPDDDDEAKKKHEDDEIRNAHERWKKQVISQHLVFVRGVEVVFFEFKEILLDIALKLRDFIDPKTGKIKVILTKFIEDHVLKKLNPYLKFNIQAGKGGSSAARVWPESQKDKEIKVMMAEKRRKEEEERKKQEEKMRQEWELKRMAEEDAPALDWKQVEEMRKRLQEEEEARRRAAEAEEEDEEEEDEDEDGDVDGDDDDY